MWQYNPIGVRTMSFAMTERHRSRLAQALEQLRSFRTKAVNAHHPDFEAWKARTHGTLHEVFGSGQYVRAFANLHFCEPRVYFMRTGNERPQWLGMDQQRFDRDAAVAEQLLTDAIEDLAEKSDDSNNVSGGVEAFWRLMHPSITDLSRPSFEAGQYADSAEKAFKAVNSRVKKTWLRAGQPE